MNLFNTNFSNFLSGTDIFFRLKHRAKSDDFYKKSKLSAHILYKK